MRKFVLSHFQTKLLLEARQSGLDKYKVSLDLGISISEVILNDTGVRFSDDVFVSWSEINKITEDEKKCYVITTEGALPIQKVSQLTHYILSLYPTKSAPTLLQSGFTMHRIKDCNPWEDTLQKIQSVSPIKGNVLDICTGLGYTAIAASRTAQSVLTIERDPDVIEIARLNPWSEKLFTHKKIEIRIGDAVEIVAQLPQGKFDRIIHDPPTMRLGGELYSFDFYVQLKRVLKRNGKLFHYIADPSSKMGGRHTPGVMKRLHEAGFRHVKKAPNAFGIVATP